MKNNILHSLMASAILERLITRLDCNDAEHKKTTAIIRGILPAYRDRVQRSLDAQSSFEMPLLKEFVQSPNLRMFLAGSGGPAKAGSKSKCLFNISFYVSESFEQYKTLLGGGMQPMCCFVRPLEWQV